jgi:hypothetical protein
MADQEYVEIVLELAPGADPAPVARWLSERGFATQRLVVGVLGTGGRDALRAAFGEQGAGEPAVPPELAGWVEAVHLTPPKEPYRY